MGPVGVQEMIVIFLVALVLFGPKKLPELGRTIGKALTEFRRAQSELKATFEHHMRELERENESLKQVTQAHLSEINDAYHSQNQYDSPYYDHGAYGSESYDHHSSAEYANPTTEGASATEGALPHVSQETALNGTVPRSTGAAGVAPASENGTAEHAAEKTEAAPVTHSAPDTAA